MAAAGEEVVLTVDQAAVLVGIHQCLDQQLKQLLG